jgi:hypothetical protein
LVIILNWESLAHGRKEFDCLPKHPCVEFLEFSPIVLQDVQLKVPVLYFEDFARIKDALAVEGAHKTHSCFWATLCCPIVGRLDSWYFCYIERGKCDSLYTIHKCTWWS